MSFKEKLSNGYKKASEWYNEHFILGTILSAVGSGAIMGLGCVIASKASKAKPEDNSEETRAQPELEEKWDPGRDCTMKFIVDETGECLGEIPCTEYYAMEEIDAFNFDSGS